MCVSTNKFPFRLQDVFWDFGFRGHSGSPENLKNLENLGIPKKKQKNPGKTGLGNAREPGKPGKSEITEK
jgi:hypothetical protein